MIALEFRMAMILVRVHIIVVSLRRNMLLLTSIWMYKKVLTHSVNYFVTRRYTKVMSESRWTLDVGMAQTRNIRNT